MPAAFELPNTLVAGTAEDIRDVQGNFEAIRDRINDGLVAQVAPGAAVVSNQDWAAGGLHLPTFVETWDTGGMFSALAADRFTFARAGFFACFANVSVDNAVAAGRWEMYFVHERGGAEIDGAPVHPYVHGAGSVFGGSSSFIAKAEVGDILRVKHWNRLGATQNGVVTRMWSLWQSVSS